MVRTPGDGGVRKPVTGEARAGDAEVERRADDERSEADGTGAASRGPAERGGCCCSGAPTKKGPVESSPQVRFLWK